MASYDDTATVSGSVVGFSNGADSVPLKNWLVTLPASLDGYSEVNGTKIESNNLLGFGSVDFTLKGVRFYTVDGVLYLDGSTVGEISSTDNAFKTNLRFYLPAGTYYLNRGSIALPTYIYDVDNMTSGNAIRTNNGSFTLAEGKTLALGFYLYQKTFSTEKLDACVNIGSTAITYEDTAAPTTYTASLGRTIYGGTADIVTGEGSETYDNTSLDDLNYNYLSNITRFNVAISGADSSGYKDNIVIPTGYTISHTLITNASNAPDMTMCMYNGSLYVKNLSCTSKAELQSALSGKTLTFPLATPTDFTFDPVTIETSKGSNTFWSDQGNTELTYYKDGYGFTSVTVHKETPEGEPIEETRKLHRIIYEGQVDVINGTGLIYRGESGTQYDPPEQISFTPIEIATDEGENTLYADQGDSAITYRKAVD